MIHPGTIKPINTVWEELALTDFPSHPPSAPSNIETITLWGPRYPGQKLHSPFTSPIEECFHGPTSQPEPQPLAEADHPEIWSRVVTLCDLLRGLIERLPEPVEEPEIPRGNPHGPITSCQLLMTGESFIQALEPVRPLLPNKLTETALRKTPALKEHVHKLEHNFDDMERVLQRIPQIYGQVTTEECDRAMNEVEAVMACLGIGLAA